MSVSYHMPRNDTHTKARTRIRISSQSTTKCSRHSKVGCRTRAGVQVNYGESYVYNRYSRSNIPSLKDSKYDGVITVF